MKLVDLAIRQAKLNKEKNYRELYHVKIHYVKTIFIAIQEEINVRCSTDPCVLENAKQCILVHMGKQYDNSYLCKGWFDWVDVGFINEHGDTFEESLDKEFWLFVDNHTRYNQTLNLKSSDGILYSCLPSWDNMANIQYNFQLMWNLYNELKKTACTKERARIVRLYEQDEKILQQKKEIANFSYANALLEKERDMYKGLLDDTRQLLPQENK